MLTCSLLEEGVVLVDPAAAADGDVVEAAGHQRVEHTLGAGLGHGQSVDRVLSVSENHQVTVHVSDSRTPRDAQEVHPAVITDRHLSHRCRHYE